MAQFTEVDPDQYSVTTNFPNGWVQTAPGIQVNPNEPYAVAVQSGQIVTGVDIGFHRVHDQIWATLWEDLDGDNVLDDGEQALAGPLALIPCMLCYAASLWWFGRVLERTHQK